MPVFLPLFPLEVVVFPGESLNLHIFEPRYRQLIEECAANDGPFGIPTHFENEVLSYGTEMELIEIAQKYPDGRMDIRTHGLRAFKISNFEKRVADKLYPGGHVEFIPMDEDGDEALNHQILLQVEQLYDVMRIRKKRMHIDADFTVFRIAHQIGLSRRQEYHLLSLTRESERQLFVNQHLKALIPVAREMEAMRKRVEMNGHFQNIKPPNL